LNRPDCESPASESPTCENAVCKNLCYGGSLNDISALADCLHDAGLDAEAATVRAKLFAQAAEVLSADAERSAFFVPGRIEVLGKHTDYSGGWTVVVAAERGFSVVVAPRTDNCVSVTAVQMGESTDFELDPDLLPAAGHWSNYPMTVARRIARNFPGISAGADIAFASDLPPAAGMSSSSAMMIGVFLSLAHVNRLAERDEYRSEIKSLTDLAGYLGTIENGQNFGSLEGDRGVGTFGGSEDHTAIICGRPGQVSQYSYCPVRFERMVPIPAGYRFAVGVCGVVAEKTGEAKEKYNAASRRASALVELWNEKSGRHDPHLAAALAAVTNAGEKLATWADSSCREDFNARSLSSRLWQFVAESEEIIPAAGDALARGDLKEFGRQVDRSQDLTDRWLGNQVPETVYLSARAREFGGAAASAFGAGFGGSVWALVEAEKMDAFLARWQEDYRREYPQHDDLSSFFSTAAAPATFQVC